MMKKKTILIVILACVVGLIGWQVLKKVFPSKKDSRGQPMAISVAVEIVPVKKAAIQKIGNFTGTLIPKSQFVIAPKISGKLEKLYINIGDRVVRGQLIAVLDDDEYSQQFIQAQADLKVAQANQVESLSSLNVAKRELERIQKLHTQGISADSELDAAKGNFTSLESRHKVAEAQVAHKEAALKAAEVRLSYTRIKASWEDGSRPRVVGERFVDEGALLTPNAPILSILEINPLIAVIHISDKDYFKVKAGQKAKISTDAFSGQTISGTITRIAPLLKETSREARVEIEIPNLEELFKPGMFVNVQIEFETRPNATVVPVSSVVKRNNQEGIFLADVENKTARFVPVKIGISTGELAEIIDPSPLSGYVVTLGQHLLVPGSPIILPQEYTGANPPDSPPSKDKTADSKTKRGDHR
ncbi:MAG: efflux RND transporter periplasmic adaptor subunit [Candidatus Aminicenantales bacterium]